MILHTGVLLLHSLCGNESHGCNVLSKKKQTQSGLKTSKKTLTPPVDIASLANESRRRDGSSATSQAPPSLSSSCPVSDLHLRTHLSLSETIILPARLLFFHPSLPPSYTAYSKVQISALHPNTDALWLWLTRLFPACMCRPIYNTNTVPFKTSQSHRHFYMSSTQLYSCLFSIHSPLLWYNGSAAVEVINLVIEVADL